MRRVGRVQAGRLMPGNKSQASDFLAIKVFSSEDKISKWPSSSVP